MEFLPMVAESATICAKATAGSGQNRRILLAFLLRGKRITADRVDRELQAWSGDRRVPGLGNSIDVLAGTRRGGLPSRSRGGGGKQPRVAGVRRRPRFPPGGGEDSTAPAPQLTLEDWVAPARCSALQSGPGEPPGSYKSVPGPPCAEDPGHDKTRHPVWAGTHTDDQSSITRYWSPSGTLIRHWWGHCASRGRNCVGRPRSQQGGRWARRWVQAQAHRGRRG
ncbi:uncharacterized protein LOC142864132 isoform X2 [Microcebus murinus]|uniref:uncharacterized protein LOC142864132 isoform X2 n=1 Tax=Microcebus murinus TaxID=30608 RepID=UPI003F6AD616